MRLPHGRRTAKPIFLFPTRPSFSTAHRRDHLLTSAALGKPLIREFLFTVVPGIFRCRSAAAFVLRGSLAYRGSMCIRHQHKFADAIFLLRP